MAGAVLCVQGIAQHPAAATWHVQQGADLQEALCRAEPGDEIVLQPGARFVGAFWLPTKAPGSAITNRSEARLPGRRLTPADATLLPTIASGSPLPALDATGASNWKLDAGSPVSQSGGGGAGNALPHSADIGWPAIPGHARYSAGAFTIEAAGSDIWDTSDQFHFVYQAVTGDADITARVVSLTNSNPWAKAGVMFRESLTGESHYGFVALTPDMGTRFNAARPGR